MTVYARSNGSYLCDVKLADQRIRKTFKTKDEAERYEKALEKKAEQPVSQQTKLHTVYEVLWQGYEAMWSHSKSERTFYIRTNQWVRDLGPDKDIRLITAALCQDLVLSYKKGGNTPNTLNKRISCLRKLMKNAKKRGVVDAVPELDYFKIEEQERRILKDDEEQRLYDELAKINPYHRWLAQFLIYTGLRVGEALNLTWDNIDLQTNKIHLWKTKGGTDRHIPILPEALEAMEAFKRFHNYGPWQQSYTAFHQAFVQAKKKMGLKHDRRFVIHSLRHTCATRLVWANVHPTTIQSWLGHKKITTTMRYMKVHDADLEAAALKLTRRVPLPSCPQSSEMA